MLNLKSEVERSKTPCPPVRWGHYTIKTRYFPKQDYIYKLIFPESIILHVELELFEALHLEEVPHLLYKGVTLLTLRIPVNIMLPIVPHTFL